MAPIAAAAASLALLGACSDDTGNNGGEGNAGSGNAGTGNAGTGGSGAGNGGSGGSHDAVCDPGPGYDEPTAARKIVTLTATVVDASGSPIVGMATQLCGTDICNFAKTDENGVATYPSCAASDPCTTGPKPLSPFTKPAFKHGSGVNYARFAYLLPAGEDFDLPAVRALELPAPGTGDALLAGQTAESGGVELMLADDASIHSEGFLTPDEEQFRIAFLDVDDAPAAVDPSLGLEMLMGVGPIEVNICPAATLSVPNTEGWAAGTQVEFLLHGIDVTEEWAPYGGWAVVSTGAVSEDGNSVVTTDGEGIPQLSVIGIRRKP